MPDTIDSDFPGSTLSHQELFSGLRELIEAATRLDRSQIALMSSAEQAFRYRIAARHGLRPAVKRLPIYGGYEPGQQARRVRDPAREAGVYLGERLGIATALVTSAIVREESLFRATQDVTIVDEGPRFFSLDGCTTCKEQGSTTCTACRGAKKQTCGGCAGAGQTDCAGYFCNGGRIPCNMCQSRGQVQRDYQDMENGRPVNRSHWIPCGSCVGGYQTCPHCYHGRITCGGCVGAGSVGCGSCGASGRITCGPSAGTGQVGEEAFVAVELASTFSFAPDASGHETVSAALAAIDVGALPGMSSRFVRGSVSSADEGQGQVLCVDYGGEVPVIQQQVQVAGRAFDLLAYGSQPRWHELSHVFDHVLGADLDRLRACLPRSAFGAPRLRDPAAMVAQLEQVLLSEANAEHLFGAATPIARSTSGLLLSRDYAASLARTVQQAVGACYTTSARRAIPWAVLGCLAGYAALWAPFGRHAGLLALPIAFVGSAWLAGHAARSLIRKGMESRDLAQRLLALPMGPGRASSRFALAAVLAAATALSFHLAPKHGPYEHEGELALLKLRLKVMTSGESLTVAQTAEALVKNERAFDWYKARRSMELLAKGGDVQASSLYGYMLYNRIGEKKDEVYRADAGSSAASFPWVEAGLQRGDSWAKLARAGQYMEGFTVEQSEQAAIGILEPLAEAGNPIATRWLAFHYSHSRPANGRKALYWHRLRVARGESAALVDMATLYWTGRAVSKNRSLARTLWKQAAAAGNPRAQAPIEKALEFTF